MKGRAAQTRNTANGFALLASLFTLVLMTLLALSMLRSVGLQEKMGSNTREKQRSLQTAQSALQYGEWWLGQGNGSTGKPCNNAVYDANVVSNVQTCSNALATLTPASTLPWPSHGDYLPPGLVVASGGGLAASGDINYVHRPSLYISYLGLDPSGKTMLYQVTGAGYGGSASGASVVQSTYAIEPNASPLDQP